MTSSLHLISKLNRYKFTYLFNSNIMFEDCNVNLKIEFRGESIKVYIYNYNCK